MLSSPDPTSEGQIRSFHSGAQVPVLQNNDFKKVTPLRSTSLPDPTSEGQIKSFHPDSKVLALQDHATAQPHRWIQPMKARSPRRCPQHPNGQSLPAPKEGNVYRSPRVGRLTTVHRGGVECRTSHHHRAVAISTNCAKTGSAPRHLRLHTIDEAVPPEEAGGEGPRIATPEDESTEKSSRSNPDESPLRWKSADRRRTSGARCKSGATTTEKKKPRRRHWLAGGRR